MHAVLYDIVSFQAHAGQSLSQENFEIYAQDHVMYEPLSQILDYDELRSPPDKRRKGAPINKCKSEKR